MNTANKISDNLQTRLWDRVWDLALASGFRSSRTIGHIYNTILFNHQINRVSTSVAEEIIDG